MLDKIGKYAVLATSIAFVFFAMWCFWTGHLDEAGESIKTFYALLIILGGPIAYCFVSNVGGAKFEMNWKWGTASFSGGYAVSVFAVVFVTRLLPTTPPTESWHLVKMNNMAEEVCAADIDISEHDPPGAVFKDLSSSGGNYRLACRFRQPPEDITLQVKFKDPSGFFGFPATIEAGDPPEELCLVRKPLGYEEDP